MDYVAIKLVENYCLSDSTLFISFGCLRYLKFCILIYLIPIIVIFLAKKTKIDPIWKSDRCRSNSPLAVWFSREEQGRLTLLCQEEYRNSPTCCSLIWFLFGPGGTERAHLFLCPPTYSDIIESRNRKASVSQPIIIEMCLCSSVVARKNVRVTF